jgi:hypothetical protein
VNAYSPRRLRISPAFFDDSFVANLFGLSSTDERLLVTKASHDLKVKLMQLEVWAHVCLHHLPKEGILRRLKDHIAVRDDRIRGPHRALTVAPAVSGTPVKGSLGGGPAR